VRLGWSVAVAVVGLLLVACDSEPAAQPPTNRAATEAAATSTVATTSVSPPTTSTGKPPVTDAATPQVPTTEVVDPSCELVSISPGFHLEHLDDDQSWGWLRLINVGERRCEFVLETGRFATSAGAERTVLDLEPLWALLDPGGELRIGLTWTGPCAAESESTGQWRLTKLSSAWGGTMECVPTETPSQTSVRVSGPVREQRGNCAGRTADFILGFDTPEEALRDFFRTNDFGGFVGFSEDDFEAHLVTEDEIVLFLRDEHSGWASISVTAKNPSIGWGVQDVVNCPDSG